MEEKNDQLLEFNNSIKNISDNIESDNVEATCRELLKLCRKYEAIFGKYTPQIIELKLFIAHLYIEHGLKSLNNKSYYSMAANILEELFTVLELELHNSNSYQQGLYVDIVSLLSGLYNELGLHQECINKDLILLNRLLDSYRHKNGLILTPDNVTNFDEDTRNKVVSLYLGIGASFSRMGEYIEARDYLELGYFISVLSYGDRDVRTLKLNYNLAANEMEGIDFIEGLRQLRFVYDDMVKYLGNDNQYTIKAKELLDYIEKDISSTSP